MAKTLPTPAAPAQDVTRGVLEINPFENSGTPWSFHPWVIESSVRQGEASGKEGLDAHREGKRYVHLPDRLHLDVYLTIIK